MTVVPGQPADGKLETGDFIVEASGKRVRSPADLRDAMEAVEPGQTTSSVVVERDGNRRPIRPRHASGRRSRDRAIFGVIVEQAADFEFPLDIEIDAGDIGGPSAGLAFALDVVDELGEDIDRGRRIAATGTIGLTGRRPDRRHQAEDDRGAAGRRRPLPRPGRECRRGAQERRRPRIVPVSTFEEALAALESG